MNVDFQGSYLLLRKAFEIYLKCFLVDEVSSTLNSLSWYAMPSSLMSSSVICFGAHMKAKSLNFPVLLFIEKSILHVSRKYGFEYKPKSSQIFLFVDVFR